MNLNFKSIYKLLFASLTLLTSIHASNICNIARIVNKSGYEIEIAKIEPHKNKVAVKIAVSINKDEENKDGISISLRNNQDLIIVIDNEHIIPFNKNLFCTKKNIEIWIDDLNYIKYRTIKNTKPENTYWNILYEDVDFIKNYTRTKNKQLVSNKSATKHTKKRKNQAIYNENPEAITTNNFVDLNIHESMQVRLIEPYPDAMLNNDRRMLKLLKY